MRVLVTAVLASFSAGLLLARVRLRDLRRRRGRLACHPTATFVFADLVGFTAMTEECGDQTAARVAQAFQHAISMLSREHGALRVKSLGDGAMIYAPDAAAALALAARTVGELGSRPDLLPVRVGAYTGTAVQIGEDWYGASVNLAARLAARAKPNEALVSHATRVAAGDEQGPWLTACGEMRLSGWSRPVTVWRVG